MSEHPDDLVPIPPEPAPLPLPLGLLGLDPDSWATDQLVELAYQRDRLAEALRHVLYVLGRRDRIGTPADLAEAAALARRALATLDGAGG